MLLTKENRRALPALGSQDGKGMEALAVVKFFNPAGSQTWYASEFDGEDTFFGLVTGMYEDELGYFSLSELASVKCDYGLSIERDRWFRPATLRECEAKRL